jgi:hypothetical protein
VSASGTGGRPGEHATSLGAEKAPRKGGARRIRWCVTSSASLGSFYCVYRSLFMSAIVIINGSLNKYENTSTGMKVLILTARLRLQTG